MAKATRKEARLALVTLFDADATFNEVLGYAPTSFDTATTKVLAIYSDNTRHDIHENWSIDHYVFTLECYVLRTNAVADENTLDDMHEAIRSVVQDAQDDATFEVLQLESTSDALFAEVSGKPYRVERHPLYVKVN